MHQMAITEERMQQLKAFDESKAGVKGLVDDGITKVPSIFRGRGPEEHPSVDNHSSSAFQIPVIDLADVGVIEKLRRAAENVGFFHMVNHGIPERVLEEMVGGIRGFHELPREVKGEYYSRDPLKKVKFLSSSSLFRSGTAAWRDSLVCDMAHPHPLDPQELPPVCRDVTMEYAHQARKLGITLFELLAEALGLKSDHLIGLECAKEHFIVGHYYPPCPEPDVTIGIAKHTDGTFMTLLLQDHIGGLQFLHQNEWIDVVPVPGSLLVNIGTLLQTMSNDKFVSAEHRVLAKKEGPRVSVGFFFKHSDKLSTEPIKELISEEKTSMNSLNEVSAPEALKS